MFIVILLTPSLTEVCVKESALLNKTLVHNHVINYYLCTNFVHVCIKMTYTIRYFILRYQGIETVKFVL